MAVLPIVEAPAEVLASRATEVDPSEFGSELVALVADMAETMYAAPGVGLAAPQVNDGRRSLSGLERRYGGPRPACQCRD